MLWLGQLSETIFKGSDPETAGGALVSSLSL